MKTILVDKPTYKQPDWISENNLPPASSGKFYQVNLNPYVIGADETQYISKTQNTTKVPAEDVQDDNLTGWTISSRTCSDNTVKWDSSWLNLVASKNNTGPDASIQGTPPANVKGTCSVTLKFNSSVIGGSALSTSTKSFTVNSTAPQWNGDPITMDVDYTGDGLYKPYVSNSLNNNTDAFI